MSQFSGQHDFYPARGGGGGVGPYTYITDFDGADLVVYDNLGVEQYRNASHRDAVQWAWTAAAAGGLVFHCAGNYSLDNTLFIISTADLSVIGEGWDTKFIPSQDANVIAIGDDADATPSVRVTVANIYFDQSAQAHWNGAGNKKGIGIYIIGNLSDATTDIIISGCYLYMSGWDAIYGYECYGRAIITECYFEECRTDYGNIHPHSCGAAGGGGWTAIGNIIRGGYGDGIRHVNVCVGNYIYDIDPVYQGGITTAEDVNLTADNRINVLRNGPGIFVWDDNALISGNSIYNVTDYGIEIYAVAGNDGITIVGNQIATILGSGAGPASIYVPTGRRNINIVGNTFKDNSYAGVTLDGADGCSVTDNLFMDVGKGAANTFDVIRLLAGADDNVVTGNHIYSAEANLPRYGVYVSASNRNWVTENRIYNIATDGVHITGASVGNIVKRNLFSTIAGDAIELNSATVDGTRIEDNDFIAITGLYLRDNGINTVLPSYPFQFTEPINGAISTTSPVGVDVDAATEAAVLWGQIPAKVNKVIRVKIWAVATGAPIGAGGQMHLAVAFNAGASNAAYNTAAKSWALADFDGEEADYVDTDVVHWEIVDGDVGNELVNLAPGDSFEVTVTYNAGADPDGATNAIFRVAEIEYV